MKAVYIFFAILTSFVIFFGYKEQIKQNKLFNECMNDGKKEYECYSMTRGKK